MTSAEETKTITKEKIANHLKNHLGLSSLICEEITQNVFSELLELTRREGKTNLQNFGTWKINHKEDRPGFNIKTGKAVNIKARKVLRFTPSQSFKKQINKKDAD